MGIAEHEAKCRQIEADVSKWGKLKPGRGITLTEGEAARLGLESKQTLSEQNIKQGPPPDAGKG